jgi:hypothetical protein
MKKFMLLIPALLVLSLLACPKPSKENQATQEGTNGSGETITEEVKTIPALIKFERGAGLYNQIADKKVEFAGNRVEQFDMVGFLGEEKEMTYIENNKEQKGAFSLCRVLVGDDMTDYWIYTENLAYNAKTGTVVSDCLLYSKDKMDKITDKELLRPTLVIVDNDYTNKDFFKIIAPSLSGKTFYYIRKSDLSLTEADIAVTRLYKAAMAFEAGKEKAKIQILESAYNDYPQSSLIDLVETELVNLGVLSPESFMEGEGMGYDEEGVYDEGGGYTGDEGDYGAE